MDLSHLYEIFSRTQENIRGFMSILSPVIANTENEHERLYFHHIFEEEEQRLARLTEFLPKLAGFAQTEESIDRSNSAFITLLQDINLEKFGLHNFLEHLELSLFEFQDEERASILRPMQETTRSDYLLVKDILTRINEEYIPQNNQTKISDLHHVHSAAHTADDHDHDTHNDDIHEHKPAIPAVQNNPVIWARKGLSVGSLKSFKSF